MTQGSLSNNKRTLIFINLLISCIASSMLATALTTALPAIMGDLKIEAATGQWLTSGYALVMGIIMPLTAFLITRFSTKKLYLTGIGIFICGLLVCALASSFQIMMAGRVLQACGNGILTAMAQVILLSIYPPERRGAIMGWYGLSIGAAPILAPTLAGILVDTCGWKMIFYIATGIMIISFVFGVFIFENVLETVRKKFDLPSFILSALTFGGITLGIGKIGSSALSSIQVLFPLLMGLLAGILFVRRQLQLSQPFLELRTLKNKNYALSVAGSMLLYLIMMGSTMMLPLYVQSIAGYPATISGLVALPGSLAMALTSPFAGKIYDRFGMKTLFIAGAFFMLLSNIGMFFITMHSPLWLAAAYNTVRCVAIGCLMMPLVTWGTNGMKKEWIADATALLTSLRTISGAIGSAVFVSIMTAVSMNRGETISIQGLNVSFLFMSIATVFLLAFAVFLVKGPDKDPGNGPAIPTPQNG